MEKERESRGDLVPRPTPSHSPLLLHKNHRGTYPDGLLSFILRDIRPNITGGKYGEVAHYLSHFVRISGHV